MSAVLPMMPGVDVENVFEEVFFDLYPHARTWHRDRLALTALGLNDTFHRHGFHVTFVEGEDGIRIRRLVRVSDIAAKVEAETGDRLTEAEIVAVCLEREPTMEAVDLYFDGLPVLCLLGAFG